MSSRVRVCNSLQYAMLNIRFISVPNVLSNGQFLFWNHDFTTEINRCRAAVYMKKDRTLLV